MPTEAKIDSASWVIVRLQNWPSTTVGENILLREKYSTVDALVYFTERVRKELNENKLTKCAFLDLSKAFHSINHTLLLKNVKYLGFNDSAAKIIKFLKRKDAKRNCE